MFLRDSASERQPNTRVIGSRKGMLLKILSPLQLMWAHPLLYHKEQAAKRAKAAAEAAADGDGSSSSEWEEAEEEEDRGGGGGDGGSTTASGSGGGGMDVAVSVCDSSDDVSGWWDG